MSPNPYRGEAALVVAGVPRILRPTFAALVAAEDELGPLFALVERAGAGVRSVSVSAAGIFLGSAAEAQVRSNAMSGTIDDYELSFEGGEKLRGRFLVQKLDYSGDFNGERNYTLQLESSGAVAAA